jgi:hypothetical protein
VGGRRSQQSPPAAGKGTGGQRQQPAQQEQQQTNGHTVLRRSARLRAAAGAAAPAQRQPRHHHHQQQQEEQRRQQSRQQEHQQQQHQQQQQQQQQQKPTADEGGEEDKLEEQPRDGALLPPLTVVALSRLVYRKGIDLLALVIPEVCARHPNVQFVIGERGRMGQRAEPPFPHRGGVCPTATAPGQWHGSKGFPVPLRAAAGTMMVLLEQVIRHATQSTFAVAQSGGT